MKKKLKCPVRLFKSDWNEQLTPAGVKVSKALTKALMPVITRASRANYSLRDLETILAHARLDIRLELLSRACRRTMR